MISHSGTNTRGKEHDGKSHCTVGTANLKEPNTKKGVNSQAQPSSLLLGSMNLKEPKRKKRVRLQPQPPLPISTNETGEWRIYTAHLSASGTCIVDPGEMEAVYSMGFFGKGSLSRSFPSFGRRRFGAPPIARNRQWIRRQKWLEELQNLNENTDSDPSPDLDGEMNENSEKEFIAGNSDPTHGRTSSAEDPPESEGTTERKTDEDSAEKIANESGDKAEKIANESGDKTEKSISSPTGLEKASDRNVPENSSADLTLEEPCNKKAKIQDAEAEGTALEIKQTEKDVEIAEPEDNRKDTRSTVCGESRKVDEVVLDSTEDEEICEIVEKGSDDDDDENDESFVEDDVCVLNADEQRMGRSEDYLKFAEDESMMEEEPNPYEVLVLPDTDSDTENYLKNVDARIEKEGFPVNETLHLTFEETFFLMYALGCLQLIHYDGSVFSINNAWNHFQMQDKYFVQKYVVYHYFRSKGWVVKPGLKYGGDFLLYKQGPPFYHASYIVIIEVMDADTLIRDDAKSMRKITWKNLIGLERLSETISKEILFAQILWPSSIARNGNAVPAEALSEFTVRELLWRRWDPKQKHDVGSVDGEDSDSA